MLKLIYIALGGAIGSLLRYSVSGFAQRLSSPSFPAGTLAVNVIGALAVGFLWAMFERSVVAPNVRAFMLIGVLGAFTTFSTYSLESFNLLRDGEIKLAAINIIASNVLCIAMVFAGFAISKAVLTAGR